MCVFLSVYLCISHTYTQRYLQKLFVIRIQPSLACEVTAPRITAERSFPRAGSRALFLLHSRREIPSSSWPSAVVVPQNLLEAPGLGCHGVLRVLQYEETARDLSSSGASSLPGCYL